jgi:hypothetical protein
MDKLPFKFNKQTSTIALAFFTLYFLYGLLYIPFTQFLVSLAIGGIAFGYTDSYEFATIALLLTNFLFPMFGPMGHSYVTKEGYMNVNPQEVSKRIQDMQRGGMNAGNVIQGVGSPMSEGFADASTTTATASPAVTPNTQPVQAASTPAPATATSSAEASTPPPAQPTPPPAAPTAISEQGVPPAHQPATAGFQDSGSLFKLGQIPTDQKGGFHIDTGTTVMNALNSLKPDQIKQMTMDTKQLIETQKSLMGMLQTFQPMMNEGRQMMNTFQQMFSPASGGQ